MEGHDLERPPGSLCASPHVGHTNDNGGGKSPLLEIPRMRYICFMEGNEQNTFGNRNVCQ